MVAVDACCVKVDWSKQANRLNTERSSPRNGIVLAQPSAHPSRSCSRAKQHGNFCQPLLVDVPYFTLTIIMSHEVPVIGLACLCFQFVRKIERRMKIRQEEAGRKSGW